MSRWRCKSCKGVYADPASDGSRYFHACPPLVDPETGEAKPRPKARDERPQDVTVTRGEHGYTIAARDGTVLSKDVSTVEIPMRAEGAGRERVP